MSSWKHLPLDLALASGPTGAGGVYLVVRVDRVLDVPTKMEALYVGRTLREFRRRFREHVDPWRAHNAALNETLLKPDVSGLELWLRELAPREARRAERTLGSVPIAPVTAHLIQALQEGKDHGGTLLVE